ncbi:ectoine synthase [Bradyrhizobium cenepequi]|uniref:ectoine synthase n=1 Tax=Bradyrhizobium cenepequi TaxID=2821403 RepID=UPI001CE2DD27|nr:ectoine synthase [Bradyrhizobium cenepequi]MCA6107053.1 ectoine synthase [Bradyrhizobium cenepequi]
MIVRSYHEAKDTERRVDSEGWHSVRLLLKDDGMGFSFHITTIHKGSELKMHYTNHVECVYCISGDGSIENLATGDIFEIRPGVMYALDQHDDHLLRANTEMITACIFNPPVTGREVHDENGAYPLAEKPASSVEP